MLMSIKDKEFLEEMFGVFCPKEGRDLEWNDWCAQAAYYDYWNQLPIVENWEVFPKNYIYVVTKDVITEGNTYHYTLGAYMNFDDAKEYLNDVRESFRGSNYKCYKSKLILKCNKRGSIKPKIIYKIEPVEIIN